MLSCLVLWQGRADSLSLTMERQQFERKLREQKAQVQKSPPHCSLCSLNNKQAGCAVSV
jgi:hypothetical protein